MNPTKQRMNTETIQPKILYYGTPVILLNTLNEDDTVNITPISSSWALGDCIVLGIGLGEKPSRTWNSFPNASSTSPALHYGRMWSSLLPIRVRILSLITSNNMGTPIKRINMLPADSHPYRPKQLSLHELWNARYKLKQASNIFVYRIIRLALPSLRRRLFMYMPTRILLSMTIISIL